MKYVRLVWEDSCSQDGWRGKENNQTVTIESIGFLVREDKKSISVSASYSPGTEHFDNTMTIPKCAVIRRTNLKLPKILE